MVENIAATPSVLNAPVRTEMYPPMSPPATPPTEVESSTPTVPMSPLVEASLHVALGQQPNRCVPQGCTQDCCNDNSATLTRSEDGDASSSNGVSDERTTEAGDVIEHSVRSSHADTTDAASEGGQSTGNGAEIMDVCVPCMSQAELSTVRITQPCKIELSGLAEECACAESLTTAAGYFGEVESAYIRAKDGFNTYSAVVHFKEDAKAAAFRAAVDAGEMHNYLGAAVAQIGTTRFCPRTIKGMRCRDACCPYAHNLPVHSARATA